MNDRIRELAEQARPTYSNGKKVLGLNSEFHEVWMEKFAQLIVQECVDRIDDLIICNDDGDQILDCDDVRTELLEHFRVKE